MMNALQQHLDRLASFIQGSAKQPLSWSRVLIIEDTAITHGKINFLPRAALATPEEYAARFEAHLEAGHSWINMNAAGILDDALLVVIELPGYFNVAPKNKVSVNLSGPNIKDGQPQWDATDRIQIVG